MSCCCSTYDLCSTSEFFPASVRHAYFECLFTYFTYLNVISNSLTGLCFFFNFYFKDFHISFALTQTCVTFVGNSPKEFTPVIAVKRSSRCTKPKYLGCNFMDRFCEIDISPSVGKFYAHFNNIVAILGKYRNEIAAAHLTETYCVPSLLYTVKFSH